jgi:hypothetical protein
VPLVHVRTGQLLKQLKLAGTPIPEQAKMLVGADILPETVPSSLEGEAALADEDKMDDQEIDGELSPALLGKFVELADLLPPIPKKGNFDVETIKGSQYFFS